MPSLTADRLVMMQVASPQRLQTNSTQPESQIYDSPQSAPDHANESDKILQRRLSSAPILPGAPSTPTRSTFPFKPAAVTPQGGSESSVFRPRPIVPAFTPPPRSRKVYTPPKRCKTFPAIEDSPSRSINIEPPAWLTDDYTRNMKRCRPPTTSFFSDDIKPLFPVPVVNEDDERQGTEEYWWLNDMSNWGPLREKPCTTVRNFLLQLRKETIGNKATALSLVDNQDKAGELDHALRELLKHDRIHRSSPEISSLNQQIIEMKRYLVNAHHLDEDKVERMCCVLKKIESVIAGGKKRSEEADSTSTIEEYYRKTKVGLAGGSLVTAGLVLIPAPVIPGILVVYGGLLVLASEFDSAKTAVESMQAPMKEFLKDEVDPNQGIYDCFHVIMWEEMIGYNTPETNELDEDFETIMRMKPWKDTNQNIGVSDDDEVERARREKKNAMKRYARQLLLLEDPVDTEEKQDENDQVNNTESRIGDISNGRNQNNESVVILAENGQVSYAT